jgi:hypothetical protein
MIRCLESEASRCIELKSRKRKGCLEGKAGSLPGRKSGRKEIEDPDAIVGCAEGEAGFARHGRD